jgi:hypothetical protein
MAVRLADWRERIRGRLRQKYPPGLRYDTEAERRLESILSFPVPADDELIAMQKRGELPSDEDLARGERG